MTDKIKEIIENDLPDAEVYVINPMNDGQHFNAFVISSQFEGQPLIKQHRRVMNALKEELKEEVHALGLKTFTPERWASEKSKYIRE